MFRRGIDGDVAADVDCADGFYIAAADCRAVRIFTRESSRERARAEDVQCAAAVAAGVDNGLCVIGSVACYFVVQRVDQRVGAFDGQVVVAAAELDDAVVLTTLRYGCRSDDVEVLNPQVDAAGCAGVNEHVFELFTCADEFDVRRSAADCDSAREVVRELIDAVRADCVAVRAADG